ncbi:hypothetical protein KCU71_g2534, partial [Aureobasidium melanogenum]
MSTSEPLLVLRLLTLRSEPPENQGSDCKPRVDNFFLAPTQCSELHALSIRAEVRGASRDLIRALGACDKLKNLTLDKHTYPPRDWYP